MSVHIKNRPALSPTQVNKTLVHHNFTL